MVEKRYIRLKEFSPNLIKLYKPSIQYLDLSPKLDSCRNYYVSIDNNGYMLSNNNVLSNKHIYLLGGSSIENLYVDCNSRIHSHLERNFLAKGCRVQVLNGGYSGSNILSLFNVLVNKIGHNINHLDRVVILFMPSNDITSSMYKESYWNGTVKHANIVPQSGVYSYIDDKKKNLVNLSNLMKLFISFCKLYDIKLYISGVVYLDNPNVDHDFFNKVNNIVKDLAIKEGVGYLDISESIRGTSEYFYDNHHILESGSKAVSDLIFDRLSANYLPEKNSYYKERVFCFNASLHSDTFWSENIKCTEGDTLNLFLDIHVLKKVNDKSLLWVFEFDSSRENIEAKKINNFIFNQQIGWCCYVKDLPESGSIVLPFKLKIPSGVSAMRVGVRRFNSNADFYLNKISFNIFN